MILKLDHELNVHEFHHLAMRINPDTHAKDLFTKKMAAALADHLQIFSSRQDTTGTIRYDAGLVVINLPHWNELKDVLSHIARLSDPGTHNIIMSVIHHIEKG